MAFSVGAGNGSGVKRRFGGAQGTLSEINIVPLVDVVLVLLIIFMLTAQVMEFGLDIQVPEVKPVESSIQERPTILVTRSGNLQLNDRPVKLHEIAPDIAQRFKNAKAVYVVADKATTWDVLAQVVAELKDAKLEISMVTKPVDTSASRR
jgi:biopolymer transport protein ExbD